jgi:hypothetical protein
MWIQCQCHDLFCEQLLQQAGLGGDDGRQMEIRQ